MTTVDFPLKPGEPDVRFKFTTPKVLEMERALGCSVDMLRLRGQVVLALTALTCYAIKWKDKNMTMDRAADLIDVYREQGGDMKALSDALMKALNESGVYGLPEQPSDPGGDGDTPNPPTTNQTTVN